MIGMGLPKNSPIHLPKSFEKNHFANHSWAYKRSVIKKTIDISFSESSSVVPIRA